jgi:glycosyltransferase involved in cell wall biosynthesis
MKDGFKVLHLSSSIEGGAGIAASRLNQALNEFGVDSRLVTISEVSGIGEITIHRGFRRMFLGKLNSLFSRMISRRTFFSSISMKSFSSTEITNWIKPGEGIIHIHNWFNMISYKQISELIHLGYKVVCTLHDERMLTGGCHYALDCRQFEQSCSACPELINPLRNLPRRAHLESLEIINRSSESLVFIAPSKWIEAQARESSLLKNSTIVCVPNSLHDFYRTKVQAKIQSGLVQNSLKIKVGIASKDPKSYIKGGDLVSEIGANQTFNESYELIFLADFELDSKDTFWEVIDLLFVPSRIDNSPNVIHEAKSLGIPVVGTNVGGIPELLDEEVDIVIEIEDVSFDFFVRNHARLKNTIKNNAAKTHSQELFRTWSENSIPQHFGLYKSLTK